VFSLCFYCARKATTSRTASLLPPRWTPFSGSAMRVNKVRWRRAFRALTVQRIRRLERSLWKRWWIHDNHWDNQHFLETCWHHENIISMRQEPVVDQDELIPVRALLQGERCCQSRRFFTSKSARVHFCCFIVTSTSRGGQSYSCCSGDPPEAPKRLRMQRTRNCR
jgi:hypothetical protein